ncbi:MAG: peptide chain release factor N(5)-glutamine methyltransferase [Clostridia bacterium]|nr:peptide chain release factor N(5)-glutamine methyltransferase [Clostridia bacterium]
MVINELIRKGADALENKVENPIREARLILAHAAEVSVSDIIVRGGDEVSTECEKKYFENIRQRACGMPFAYITGEQEFFGLKFAVNENVLIPRSDTEILVEFALSAGGKTVLDICTGSGCIAVALAKNLPDSKVSAVDISPAALEIAKKNASANGCDNVSFFETNILSEIPGGKFDLIVSNPPYIEKAELSSLMKDVIEFEPRLALDGGDDGLIFYRRICVLAPQILNKGGTLAFEIGYNQYESVYEIMKENFSQIGYKEDLSGIKRVLYGKL